MSAKRLTVKQRKFINEYIISGNATQAAIKAGYKKSTAAAAASENLQKPHIVAEIDKRLGKMDQKKVLTAEELLAYLASVVRGESRSEEIVIEGQGKGVSEARIMKKGPSESDKIAAAKMLAKRLNIDVSKAEAKAKAERLELENEKLKLEIDKLRGGDADRIDDGFLEALSGSAKEDWTDEAAE